MSTIQVEPPPSWRQPFKRIAYTAVLQLFKRTCMVDRHWRTKARIGPELHGRAGMVLNGHRCRLCGATFVDQRDFRLR